MDERTKKNLQEFEALATKKMAVGPGSEWEMLGAVAMRLGIVPALMLRIAYYIWLDLKTRIEARP